MGGGGGGGEGMPELIPKPFVNFVCLSFHFFFKLKFSFKFLTTY